MWLCKGYDVTNNSEVQYPSTLGNHGKRRVHPTETESGICSSDVTAGAVAWIMPPEAREPEDRGSGR